MSDGVNSQAMANLRVVPTITQIMGITYTERIREAFPEADPGLYPFGYNLIVQLRTPKAQSKGGIIFSDQTKDADRYRMQTGLVRALGPGCFKRRDNGEAWTGGDWCHEGDFVRCPMYGGDRWFVKCGDKPDDIALFMTLRDTDLIGLVTGDPLEVITS